VASADPDNERRPSYFPWSYEGDQACDGRSGKIRRALKSLFFVLPDTVEIVAAFCETP
jgi:hypothetical protein